MVGSVNSYSSTRKRRRSGQSDASSSIVSEEASAHVAGNLPIDLLSPASSNLSAKKKSKGTAPSPGNLVSGLFRLGVCSCVIAYDSVYNILIYFTAKFDSQYIWKCQSSDKRKRQVTLWIFNANANAKVIFVWWWLWPNNADLYVVSELISSGQTPIITKLWKNPLTSAWFRKTWRAWNTKQWSSSSTMSIWWLRMKSCTIGSVCLLECTEQIWWYLYEILLLSEI